MKRRSRHRMPRRLSANSPSRWLLPALSRLLVAALCGMLGLPGLAAATGNADAAAAAGPQLSVQAPSGLVEKTFYADVYVYSVSPIAEVTAIIGDRTTALQKLPGSCGYSCRYGGFIDSGLDTTPGTVKVTYRAVDVDGLAATAQHTYGVDMKPVVMPVSPLPYAVADPELALDLSCADDDEPGCVLVTVKVNASKVAESVYGIHETVNIGQWDRRQLRLNIEAKDSAGQTTYHSFPFYVESGPELTRKAHARGLVLDHDDTRLLYWDAYYHRLIVRDLITSEEETLPFPVAENRDLHVFLTPDGVMGGAFDATGFPLPDGYYEKGLDPMGRYLVFEWKRGSLTEMAAASILVNGDFAVFLADDGSSSGPKPLVLRNLKTGDETTVDVITGADYEISADGTLVYAKGGQIYLYRAGDAEPSALTSDKQYRHSWPRTDGRLVVYTKRLATSDESTIVLVDTGGDPAESELGRTEGYPKDYAVAYGWVAFNRMAENGQRQLWVRSPEGAEERLTPTSTAQSRLDSLAPNGDVTYIYNGELIISRLGPDGREPSKSLTLDKARSFWRNGWQIYLGAAWYGLNDDGQPPVKPVRLEASPVSAKLFPGETVSVTASVYMSDGTRTDVTARTAFRSSDPEVASVGEDGIVRALSPGHTEIALLYEGLTASAVVEVKADLPPDTPPGDPADLNDDGNVDVRDLIAFLKAIGTSADDPHFIPKADYDRDGRIGSDDGITFILLYRNAVLRR